MSQTQNFKIKQNVEKVSGKKYSKEIMEVQLINQVDLKKSILLKRRVNWGEQQDFKYECRKKIQNECQIDNKQVDSLQCPICMEIFACAIATVCGHSFCEKCLFEGFLRKPQCPICRTNIRNQQFLYCHVLDTQIQSIVKQSNDEALVANFLSRMQENKEWNEKRKLTDIKINQELDVMDTENIWCIGKVVEIKSIKNEKQVLIHYQGWHKMYDEYLPFNSYRIAPKGVFTSRKDIPRYYQPSPNDQNDAIYSHVIQSDPDFLEDGNRLRGQGGGLLDLLSFIVQRRHQRIFELQNNIQQQEIQIEEHPPQPPAQINQQPVEGDQPQEDLFELMEFNIENHPSEEAQQPITDTVPGVQQQQPQQFQYNFIPSLGNQGAQFPFNLFSFFTSNQVIQSAQNLGRLHVVDEQELPQLEQSSSLDLSQQSQENQEQAQEVQPENQDNQQKQQKNE